MAGPFREKIFAALVKVETTSGVDSVPVVGTDAVRLVNGPTVLAYDFMEGGSRDDEQTGVLSGADRAAPAGAYGKIDIAVGLKGAGAVYSASVKPEADPLWRASGLPATSSFTGGSENYFYKTADTNMETVTVYLYSANKLFKMVGCVAQPKLSAEVYKKGIVTFTVTGKITSITEASLPSIALNTLTPPLFHSAAAAIGAWTTASAEPLMLLSASMDLGTAIADLSSAGATDGLVGWLITDRNVTQEFTFNVPALATYNPFVQAGTDGGSSILTAWQVGVNQYTRVKIEARWAPNAPREGARNGVKTYTQSGICKVGSGLSGGREIQITYN
jgi:hypothetical protein